MEVIIPSNKRKIIDLKDNTFHTLSIMAAQHGTNLKRFIEKLLDHTAERYDDAALYKYLCEEKPEGKILLNEQEKKDFEDWLGLNVE